MRTKFKVKAKGQWSPAKRAAVKAATRWASKKLQLKTLPINLTVRLVGSNDQEFGSCSMIDKVNYVVWVHSGYSISRTLSTLFHELTHVKQHWYDGLVLDEVTKARFKGDYYALKNYWNCPWEVEARNFERKLMSMYYVEKNNEIRG